MKINGKKIPITKMWFYSISVNMTGRNERKSCKGCIYRRSLGTTNPNFNVCHYLYDTGEPRGCPADKCTKKITQAQLMEQRKKEAVENGGK